MQVFGLVQGMEGVSGPPLPQLDPRMVCVPLIVDAESYTQMFVVFRNYHQ